MKGDGVAQNPQRALELYRKACRIPHNVEDHYLSCQEAGMMLLNGKGVPKDAAAGTRLLRMGCTGMYSSNAACSILRNNP